MNPLEVIKAKRQHLARMANQSGASGELCALSKMEHWTPRPRGAGLKVLLAALAETGLVIKGSSFDAIAFPSAEQIDFTDPDIGPFSSAKNDLHRNQDRQSKAGASWFYWLLLCSD